MYKNIIQNQILDLEIDRQNISIVHPIIFFMRV